MNITGLPAVHSHIMLCTVAYENVLFLTRRLEANVSSPMTQQTLPQLNLLSTCTLFVTAFRLILHSRRCIQPLAGVKSSFNSMKNKPVKVWLISQTLYLSLFEYRMSAFYFSIFRHPSMRVWSVVSRSPQWEPKVTRSLIPWDRYTCFALTIWGHGSCVCMHHALWLPKHRRLIEFTAVSANLKVSRLRGSSINLGPAFHPEVH